MVRESAIKAVVTQLAKKTAIKSKQLSTEGIKNPKCLVVIIPYRFK